MSTTTGIISRLLSGIAKGLFDVLLNRRSGEEPVRIRDPDEVRRRARREALGKRD